MIDPKIVEECRAGNLNQFRELVRISSPFVFSIAFRMLGDDENAKDVVQEVMITVWQKLARMKSAGAYKTWIYKITMNKCYDRLRYQKKSPEVRGDDTKWAILSNTIPDAEDGILDNNDISAILNLLTENLSPKQKSVFILSDIEELSNAQISEITGLNRNAVKSNLCFARRNISEMFQKYVK